MTNRFQVYDRVTELNTYLFTHHKEKFSYKGFFLPDLCLAELYVAFLNPKADSNTMALGFQSLLKYHIKFARYRSLRPVDARDKVIFFPTDITHLRQILPIAKELAEIGHSPLFVTTKATLVEKIKKENFAVRLIFPALFGPALPLADRGSIELEWLTEELWTIFTRSLLSNLPYIVSVIDYCTSMCSSRPAFLFVGNDIIRDARTAVTIFKHYSRPTFAIMHGNMTGDNPLHRNLIVDEYFLFGDLYIEEFDRLGFPKEKLHVVGSPGYDEALREQGIKKDEVLKPLNLNTTLPVVLVALSGPGHALGEEEHIAVLQQLFSLIRRLSHAYNFIVKLHTKDKLEYYEPLLSEGVLNTIVVDAQHLFGKYSILNWLKISDILLTGGSSSCLEAMLSKVPAVSFDPFRKLDSFNFIQSGAVAYCTDLDRLEYNLVDLTGTTGQRQMLIGKGMAYIEKLFYQIDGNAAKRVVGKLKSYI
ncbi:MAG: hypothetical protein ACOYXT_14050 [Bacteroidota bacterium]